MNLKMNFPLKIPVFPLKGVIVFPNSVLPLNIFEKRYVLMIEDILKTKDRLIGIVQPKKSNFEPNNLSLQDIGCVTKLIKFEDLGDGRFLVSLKGISRYRTLTEELTKKGYKKSKINFKNFEMDMDLSVENKLFKYKNDKRLKLALTNYFKKNKINSNIEYINGCENKDLVNQVSMICPFDPSEKQMLLEANSTEDRYILLISILEDNLNLENKNNVIKH